MHLGELIEPTQPAHKHGLCSGKPTKPTHPLHLWCCRHYLPSYSLWLCSPGIWLIVCSAVCHHYTPSLINWVISNRRQNKKPKKGVNLCRNGSFFFYPCYFKSNFRGSTSSGMGGQDKTE